MGRGGQIEQLLSDLPVDETWVLLALAVLTIAAISHLYGMWREAGMGIGAGTDGTHPVENYLEAWEDAGEDTGLEAHSREGALDGARLVGQLRGLETEMKMELQRSGRRNPNPEAINPATARCCITGRVELPFPWEDATVHRFIRPKSLTSKSVDGITVGELLPPGVELESARLSRQSRLAISEMVDDFKTVQVVRGTLTVVDVVNPSRNTSQWTPMFRESIARLRRQVRAFADGGLTVCLKSPRDGEVEIEIEIEPGRGDDEPQLVELLEEYFEREGEAGVERSG